jgi:hypothetical protein
MQRAIELARVRQMCVSFARNLAYYRARQDDGERLTPETDYWNSIHDNCVDKALLEWCKLFGSERENYHWKKIITDLDTFECELLRNANTSADEFASYTSQMKRLRDKFVVHLDYENEMFLPLQDVAWSTIQTYFNRVTDVELIGVAVIGPGEMPITEYYNQKLAEALSIHRTIR